MKGHNKTTEIIVAYLEEQRNKDNQLEEAMSKAEENKKTSEDMWEYIQNKAKESLGGQNGAIDSETVFGWAIHYMVESKENLAKEIPQPKPAEPKQEIKQTPKQETKKKETKEKQDPGYIQISLFD